MIENPEHVKIGPFTIKIEWWAHQQASGVQRFGEFSAVEQVMRLDESMAPVKMMDTFLHEVIHAIFWVYGMEDDDKEERYCNTLGTALTAFWLDNKHIVAWLNDLANPKFDAKEIARSLRENHSNAGKIVRT